MPSITSRVAFETTRSRMVSEVTSSRSRNQPRLYVRQVAEVTKVNPLVVNHPAIGAQVTIAEIIELDLANVGAVLASHEVREFLREDLQGEGLDEAEAFAEMPAWNVWLDSDGPKAARELWRAGQRVLARIGTATVEDLPTRSRKRAYRMQYQRNP